MDELDLLKKDWKKQEGSFQQISEKEIYGMLHKGSSSIVKWILIISVLEFLFLRLLDLSIFLDDEYSNRMKEHHIYDFEKFVTIFNFVVLLVFIYYFYRNLKAINSSSSVKKLMQDIINTRKIVKYYVWYNLVLVGITSAIVIYSQFMYDKNINHLYDKYQLFFILGGFFFVIIILLLFWLFYRLLYGILMRRLEKNYNELKKIDY
jgi:ABC-type bacteriocin/lantibiotic exporter with double-glycine peptidase domain